SIIPTLCLALPSATHYPLLRLLTDCTPAQPTPTPAPRAPKKTTEPHHHLPSDADQTLLQIQCGPWTVTASHYSLDLRTVAQGTQLTLTVRL
ncbi:E4, partial [Macaca fascicularis papillomavirus 9]